MSKTKIIVLQMKELVYTGIFVGLGILLIVLLFVMFYPKKEKSSDATADVTAEAASYVLQQSMQHCHLLSMQSSHGRPFRRILWSSPHHLYLL